MTKTVPTNAVVSVNILGESTDLDLEEFVNMYTNEIKSLKRSLTYAIASARYQLIVEFPNCHSIEATDNRKKLEDKLDKALRAVELCAKRLFANEHLLQTSRSK